MAVRRQGILGIAAILVFLAAAPCSLAAAPPARLVVAGDIACGEGTAPSATECQQNATAALVASLNPTAVAPLGDEQYENGTAFEFANFWAPSWGALRFPVHPVPGNHEYHDPAGNAAGYYGYFGAAAGNPATGYYSYNLGAWHVIALNSNCNAVPCGRGSVQERWLRADLNAHRGVCTLAYWHHPLFTSGETSNDPNNAATVSFWRDLYVHGADLVLNAHDHDYQRYALQEPSGGVDRAQGLREIVVGTGGRSLFQFTSPVGNTEVRDDGTFGVLLVTLDRFGYSWQFVPTVPGGFSDSGSGTCHETASMVKLPRSVGIKMRTGRGAARAHCANASGDRCAITLVLRGRHRAKVATAKAKIAGGSTGTLTFRQTRRGRAMLKKAKGQRLRVTASGQSKNRLGQATILTRHLTLKGR